MLLLHACRKAGGRYIFVVEKQKIIPNIMGDLDKNVRRNQGKSHEAGDVLLFEVFTELAEGQMMLPGSDTRISRGALELSGLVWLAQVVLSRAAPPPGAASLLPWQQLTAERGNEGTRVAENLGFILRFSTHEKGEEGRNSLAWFPLLLFIKCINS